MTDTRNRNRDRDGNTDGDVTVETSRDGECQEKTWIGKKKR